MKNKSKSVPVKKHKRSKPDKNENNSSPKTVPVKRHKRSKPDKKKSK